MSYWRLTRGGELLARAKWVCTLSSGGVINAGHGEGVKEQDCIIIVNSPSVYYIPIPIYFYVILPPVSMFYCLMFLCHTASVSMSYCLLFLCHTASCFYVIQPPVSILYYLEFLCHFALCFYVLLPTVSMSFCLLFLNCTTSCFYVILPCVSMSYWQLTEVQEQLSLALWACTVSGWRVINTGHGREEIGGGRGWGAERGRVVS